MKITKLINIMFIITIMLLTNVSNIIEVRMLIHTIKISNIIKLLHPQEAEKSLKDHILT